MWLPLLIIDAIIPNGNLAGRQHPALWESDDPTGGATVCLLRSIATASLSPPPPPSRPSPVPLSLYLSSMNVLYIGRRRYTPAMIEEALHKSLAALQTEVIDLYQVHWPGNIGLKGGPDDWKIAAGCVAALEKARADGLIRHWGVCNFGTEDLLALDKAGGGGAVTNQLPYNLLCQLDASLPFLRLFTTLRYEITDVLTSFAPAGRAIEHGILPACEARGMAVLAYSPLQQVHCIRISVFFVGLLRWYIDFEPF